MGMIRIIGVIRITEIIRVIRIIGIMGVIAIRIPCQNVMSASLLWRIPSFGSDPTSPEPVRNGYILELKRNTLLFNPQQWVCSAQAQNSLVQGPDGIRE